MTRRLYYDDSYLTEFRATVLDPGEDRCRVVLQETAFYPSSGGQPSDRGSINDIAVEDVVDDGDRIIHVLAAPMTERAADCSIGWARRFDHMQQHTGQHLLSAVIAALFDAPTVAFHMGAESSTIEIGAAVFDSIQIRAAEQRANQIVFENRPVTVSYADAAETIGLRKPPEREGVFRIISIEGLDRSACGGTHVRQTGEIGPISIRKAEKLRGNTRLEFLCGSRAVRRARADYEQLSAVAQIFSSPLDDAAALVTGSMARLQESEKARQKLAGELANARGRQLYHDSGAGPDGLRRYWMRIESGGTGDDVRREAQSFTAHPRAVFLATCNTPGSLLLAVSADAGIHAGEWLKPRLQQAGGKGGGNAQLAQGSVPDPHHLLPIAAALGFDT
jgi:alanyl-tRNA synthetase